MNREERGGGMDERRKVGESNREGVVERERHSTKPYNDDVPRICKTIESLGRVTARWQLAS